MIILLNTSDSKEISSTTSLNTPPTVESLNGGKRSKNVPISNENEQLCLKNEGAQNNTHRFYNERKG